MAKFELSRKVSRKNRERIRAWRPGTVPSPSYCPACTKIHEQRIRPCFLNKINTRRALNYSFQSTRQFTAMVIVVPYYEFTNERSWVTFFFFSQRSSYDENPLITQIVGLGNISRRQLWHTERCGKYWLRDIRVYREIVLNINRLCVITFEVMFASSA